LLDIYLLEMGKTGAGIARARLREHLPAPGPDGKLGYLQNRCMSLIPLKYLQNLQNTCRIPAEHVLVAKLLNSM